MNKQTRNKVPLTQQLEANEFYDLIIVTVRLDQLDAVIPTLKNNATCHLIMLMLNMPEGIQQLIKNLHPKHVILGFPGAGGTYQNNILNSLQIKQQATTVGELNGAPSLQSKEVKAVFEKADFAVTVSANMEAGLKTHAVFVTCIAAAIVAENGSSFHLHKNKSSVKVMVQSIREGFKACKALRMSIAPANLKIIFMMMPQWFCILYWQKAMQGELSTLAMAPHANKAKGEMQLLAKNVMSLVHSSSFPTPTLDKLLLSFINSN